METFHSPRDRTASTATAGSVPPAAGSNAVHVLREAARLDKRIEEETFARERTLAALEERLSSLILAQSRSQSQAVGASVKHLDAEEIRLRLRATEEHLANAERTVQKAAASVEQEESSRKQMAEQAAADLSAVHEALASQGARLTSSISDLKDEMVYVHRVQESAKEQEKSHDAARAEADAETHRSVLEHVRRRLKDDVAQVVKEQQEAEREDHRRVLENLEIRLKTEIARSSSSHNAMMQEVTEELQVEMKDKCQKLASRFDEYRSSQSAKIADLNEQIRSACDLANAATDLAHQACQVSPDQTPDRGEIYEHLRQEFRDHLSQEVRKEVNEEVRKAGKGLSGASLVACEQHSNQLRDGHAAAITELQTKLRAEAQLEYEALREVLREAKATPETSPASSLLAREVSGELPQRALAGELSQRALAPANSASPMQTASAIEYKHPRHNSASPPNITPRKMTPNSASAMPTLSTPQASPTQSPKSSPKTSPRIVSTGPVLVPREQSLLAREVAGELPQRALASELPQRSLAPSRSPSRMFSAAPRADAVAGFAPSTSPLRMARPAVTSFAGRSPTQTASSMQPPKMTPRKMTPNSASALPTLGTPRASPIQSPRTSPKTSPRIVSTDPALPREPVVPREQIAGSVRTAGSLRFGTPPAAARRAMYVQGSPRDQIQI